MNTPSHTRIPVFIRSVYGQERIYIADNDLAQHVKTLTNRDTLRATDISALQSLGFSFSHVPDPNALRDFRSIESPTQGAKLWEFAKGFSRDVAADMAAENEKA